MSDKAMEKYPELLWLTGDVNATPEGANAKDDKYKEYNRTMLSIELLKWVISGDYERFTECQQPRRLSRKSLKKYVNTQKGLLNLEKI